MSDEFNIKRVASVSSLLFGLLFSVTLGSFSTLLLACGDTKINTAEIIIQNISADLNAYNSTIYDLELRDLYVINQDISSTKVNVNSNENLNSKALVRDFPYTIYTITWLGEDTTSIELRAKIHYSVYFRNEYKVFSIDDPTEYSFATISALKNNSTILATFKTRLLDTNRYLYYLEEVKEIFTVDVSIKNMGNL